MKKIFLCVCLALVCVCFASLAPGAQNSAPAPLPISVDSAPQASAAAPALPAVSPQSAPAPVAAPAQTTATPPLPDISLSWSGYFQALAILCLALAALWALLWLVKRRGGIGGMTFSSGQGLRVESRLALGPKKWLLVVRYMDRRLVIGVAEQNISLLTELCDGEKAPAAGTGDDDTPGLSFASLLKKDKEPPQTS
ncbi:flagellar biosynthetic protein FliO [Desulfovibrio sp. OttesenSCG-928-F20]|nr:flagellar biosynthetic protein FliO [Desulfovibrio sp. OttesenSCG-928-M16]MDL2291416.1 flagellar biosynthetic protein FliO [Desulfovibrio sp. OttesenSCG-928-F20]